MQAKREMSIMSILRKNGVAQVNELSEVLGVSTNTIRRDLKSLEQQGMVRMARGGAVLPDDVPMGAPLTVREDQFHAEKERIGRRACELIGKAESILLDAGTTTEQIALQLRDQAGLTVVTNALNVLLHLIDVQDISVVSTGGVFNAVTRCSSGFHAEQFLAQFRVDIAFLSAGGITTEGVRNTNTVEVQIKKTMMQIADRRVLAITHDKIGKVSLAPFANVSDFDSIITDDKADPAALERLHSLGPDVITC